VCSSDLKQIDDKVAKLKSLMKKMEKINSENASSAIDKLQEKVKDQLGGEQLRGRFTSPRHFFLRLK
jgi:hypothetical protein